jgi:NAD(P)-dependent dehydrogenase (short-subunit alcohol dehydrogenase family)
MGPFDSIRNLCNMYIENYMVLDILIHKAAYFNHGAPYRQSPDGIEITFATNVAGPFLMTMLLRGLLAASDDARVLHAGSNIIKHFLNPKKEIDLIICKKSRKIHVHIVYTSTTAIRKWPC